MVQHQGKYLNFILNKKYKYVFCFIRFHINYLKRDFDDKKKKKSKLKTNLTLLKYSQVEALLLLSYSHSIQNMNRLLCVVCQEFHHQDTRAVNQM